MNAPGSGVIHSSFHVPNPEFEESLLTSAATRGQGERTAGRHCGLTVAGVLGELIHAKLAGWIPKVRDEIQRLRMDAGFFVDAGGEQFILSQELEPRIQIVGEAATMLSAIEATRRLSPDVILMDVRLPDGDGIEACRRIKVFLPETRILFLTSYADNRFVLAAMEAGADGYLLKESDAQRIVDAIHSILAGGTVFDPVVTREVMGSLKSGGKVNPLHVLTAQECRVMEEVAKGKTDKEVAATLNLTTKTARNYLDRIFTKLNVHSRTEAALLYTRFRENGNVWD